MTWGARDEELSLELVAPLPLELNRGDHPHQPLLELHKPNLRPGSSYTCQLIALHLVKLIQPSSLGTWLILCDSKKLDIFFFIQFILNSSSHSPSSSSSQLFSRRRWYLRWTKTTTPGNMTRSQSWWLEHYKMVETMMTPKITVIVLAMVERWWISRWTFYDEI